MKNSIKLILFFYFFVLTAVGQTMKETAKGNSSFAFDIYKEIFSEDQNVFFSPYSISSALAMTYAGARGETEKQMSKVLHYDLKQENTHRGFNEINSALNKYQDNSLIKLSIANALWKSESWHFKEEYLDLTKKYYNASIFPLHGAKPINDWADLNTHGKIKEIIDGDLSDARLVLTNAIYFKGDWLTKFDEKATQKSKFNMANGQEVDADMMFMTNKVNYFEDADKQIIELPYKNENMSMIIVLPRERSSINSIAMNMDYNQFSNFNSNFTNRKVHISLPKFKFSSFFKLEKVLPKMGMPDAFNGLKADFTGMSTGLSISKVLHKAVIEVNEKGSEAAAVTAVIMIEKSSKHEEEIIFNANRPFMFYIFEKTTNSILFMGSVMDPTKE